jgi:hypothetical protein
MNMKTKLFRIAQVSENAIVYLIEGLCGHYSAKGCSFVSEFDPKSGDYYVVLEATAEVTEDILPKILSYNKV